IISPEFKKAGNRLYYFRHTPQENGLPDYSALKDVFEFIYSNIQNGQIVSVKTIKDGGAAVALAKMSFGNKLGVEVSLAEEALLSTNLGRLSIAATSDLSHPSRQETGEVTDTSTLVINGLEVLISKLLEAWIATFDDLIPAS